jgi:hypothetical protein
MPNLLAQIDLQIEPQPALALGRSAGLLKIMTAKEPLVAEEIISLNSAASELLPAMGLHK